MLKFTTGLFFLLCSFNLFSAPQILCEDYPLFDDEIHIQVIDLNPNQLVSIEVSSVDSEQTQWISSALFQADTEGVIKIAEQAAIDGSYAGIDGMGLFWSMEMGNIVISHAQDDTSYTGFARPVIYHLRVLDENGEIAQKEIHRFLMRPDVEVIELRENGLIGDLFIPPSDELLPVVIVLTGSNGGIPSSTGSLLASHGIAAFALAYSGVGDLPPSVEDVHIEYFERAFEWIENHPRLNGKIALYGSSRGAELALLLGTMFPEKIDRIVAKAPSSVVLSNFSWMYKDQPVLPAAPFFVDLNHDYFADNSTRDHPKSYRIHRERGFFLERERYEAAAIPVEKIKCPIMLISGGDDQLGPCSLYAEQILDRLDEHESDIERIHLDYPKAGHLISIPYLPRFNVICDEGVWINLGGTPFEDEHASRDSWEQTLEFLQD